MLESVYHFSLPSACFSILLLLLIHIFPMRNSMKMIGITTVTAVFLAWGATSIYAHGWGGANNDTLIQRIVQRFGLKTEDVQGVFDTVRGERQDEMQQKMTERLDTLVKQGKITEAQKKLIVAKHAELQAQREKEMESMKDLTPEERRTKMEAHRTELESWAKQNNIDIQYVIGFGRGKGLGMGRWTK